MDSSTSKQGPSAAQQDFEATVNTGIRESLAEARLLLMSAHDRKALDKRLLDLNEVLANDRLKTPDIAYTLAVGRKAFAHRAMILLPEGRRDPGSSQEFSSRGLAPKGPAEVVLMFPGQGSQFLGMGRQLYETSAKYREVMDHCDAVLQPRLDVDLGALLLDPAWDDTAHQSELLTQTAVAQPALFVVEYALAQVLIQYGVKPTSLIGHSIGEFTAACLAGVFELDAALELVCERGRLMQSMPAGAMLAIKDDPDQITDLLGDSVDLAAHNAPGVSVVSGPFKAIGRVKELAERRGLECRSLQTSHAFHSSMMDPILEEFERVVAQARPLPPRLSIISTMTGQELSAEEATSSTYWAKQLRNPVRFAEAATTACTGSNRLFVEVGPGVSLMTSVVKLTDIPARPRRVLETLGHPKSALPATDATLKCVGQLWIENAELDFESLYRGKERKFVRLPSYPYSRSRHWVAPPRQDVALARNQASPHTPQEFSAEVKERRDDLSPSEIVLGQVIALLAARLGRALEENEYDRKFLELGFDSLGLSQLAGKVKEQFQIRVPVRQLFDSLATPHALAEYLANDQSTSGRLSPRGEQNQSPSGVPTENTVPSDFGDATHSVELTASQQEIWLASRIGGTAASLSYNECRAFLFSGDLNEQALESALALICQRHEGLRQTFSEDGETCLTVPQVNFELEHCDLRPVDGEESKHSSFSTKMREQVETPFNLSSGPLLRGTLIRLADSETALVLCAHHISVDGSSWEVLIRELSESYSAHVEERRVNLPAPVPFSAYAAEERSYRKSDQARDDASFWLEHLRGQAEDLNLPTDRARPASRSYTSTRSDHFVSRQLTSRLKTLAISASCTPQTLLFAAFQILLFRLSRQLDIVCGVPTSGQARAAMDPLVGHCVHVLPLRFLMNPSRTVAEHLKLVHETVLDGLEHQRTNIADLLSKLDRPRDSTRPALVQVSFGMGRSQKRPPFVGVDTALQVVPRVSENFELYVYATEASDELEVSWSYNTDLFDPETIELWQRCFLKILQSMSDGCFDETLGGLDILPEGDRSQLLQLAKGARIDRGDYLPVHRWIEGNALSHPTATAVIDATTTCSYEELDRKANKVAHYLLGQNLPRNSLIGICLSRNIGLVATLLGVWRAGMGYVPLDPEYPAERIQTILEDASAALILTSLELSGRIADAFEPVCLEDINKEIEKQPASAPDVESAPGDTAYVIFTSGSTGRPKGVQISQEAFLNFIFSMKAEPGFSGSDTLLALTTISFDISGLELFLPLVCGGKLVLGTREDAVNPPSIARLLETHAVTVLQATPATWQVLFESGWQGNPRLKVLCGGEAFPRHLAEKFLTSCGAVWNVYGPTETTVWSTAKRIVNHSDMTIGRPIENTTCYVLDDNQALVPLGTPGELWIGGQGVAIGYLGRPELTAERFIKNPFDPNDRLYRTGDLARLRRDGEFECLGRVDFQVKIRGYRIELGEVESQMLDFAGVAACVATAREGRPEGKFLAGYVVPQSGESLDVEGLRQFLMQKLPPYMVPTAFCVLDSLPMTPNKKVDRKALPEPVLTQASGEAVTVTDDIEKAVLEIWVEVLRYPGLRPADNFYAVGGHSLMAIRLIDRINQKFETDLPVNELFNQPTVEGVSELLRQQLDSVTPSTPASRQAPASSSLSFAPHKGLFRLQQGSETSVPILLIHGDQSNALLPPRLHPEQELWGYHHQGSDGERIQFRTVEELATRCHQEWIERHGDRPCMVSGHSYGALIAYHVAILRQRDGLTTPRVIIIDARHPDALESRQKGLSPRKLKRRFETLREHAQAKKDISRAEAYLARGEAIPPELRGSYILGAYRIATEQYRPPKFHGALEVLRSKQWTQRSFADMWEHSAVGSIRRVVLEGSHMSLVREPEGVELVAEQFRRMCLEVHRCG